MRAGPDVRVKQIIFMAAVIMVDMVIVIFAGYLLTTVNHLHPAVDRSDGIHPDFFKWNPDTKIELRLTQ